ncbi:hypothetical protein GCM10027347_58580 [Larkinella harenae]
MNDFKNLLAEHTTLTLYKESRENLLQLINRKISYKEHLIKRQDEELNEQLHKSITTIETEINTLLSFVMAFDRLAEYLRNETAVAVDEYHIAKRKNNTLLQLIDAETERATEWSTLAFDLHDHILKSPKPIS